MSNLCGIIANSFSSLCQVSTSNSDDRAAETPAREGEEGMGMRAWALEIMCCRGIDGLVLI